MYLPGENIVNTEIKIISSYVHRLSMAGSSQDDDLAWRVVAKQYVPGAGRTPMPGLVATRNLDKSAKNSYICDYHIAGVYETDKEANEGGHYVIYAAAKKFLRLTKIDRRKNLLEAYDNKVGNLVNHGNDQQSNAKISKPTMQGGIYTSALRAIKPIKKGEAIITNYGDQSWTRGFKKKKRDNKKMYPNLLQGPKKAKKAKKATKKTSKKK
jgi:hypothetical protein